MDSLFTRISSHQTGSADELELVAVHYGKFKTDKEIHPLLESSHSHLEWFENTEEVKTFIKLHFLVFPNALSLLTQIRKSMDQTIAPETVGIAEYVKGNIKINESDVWLKEFDGLQFLNNAISQRNKKS